MRYTLLFKLADAKCLQANFVVAWLFSFINIYTQKISGETASKKGRCFKSVKISTAKSKSKPNTT
jgi:hypothetical protein